jgi:hypothetical protein
MLATQVVVNLLLKLAIRMNLVGHGELPGEGSSSILFSLHYTDGSLSGYRHGAGAGFFAATQEVSGNPPFGVDFHKFPLREHWEQFLSFDLRTARPAV